ncbi:hypothetical protein C8R44DRAFT_744143 [Mycena epipterygia]|nr:hypothetical protein C8R44DRAFT_744143 [Mycena epipterygia]
MTSNDVDDSAYESDTGPRDNPRCSNFENNRPVSKTLTVPTGRYTRVLNRQGRAICRIVHPHGWTAAQICHIFGTRKAVRKALLNTYSPPDRTSEDYDYVEAEFKEKYPPLKTPVTQKKKAPVENYSSDEEDRVSEDDSPLSALKRPHTNTPSGDVTQRALHLPQSDSGLSRTAKKPRYDHVFGNGTQTARPSSRQYPWDDDSSSVPSTSSIPIRPKPQPSGPTPPNQALPKRPPALSAFLKDVLGLDLSQHLPLLTARGVADVATLRTMAAWDRVQLQETLTRVLMGSPQDLGGRVGLTALEVVSLELAIRNLNAKTT